MPSRSESKRPKPTAAPSDTTAELPLFQRTATGSLSQHQRKISDRARVYADIPADGMPDLRIASLASPTHCSHGSHGSHGSW